jgi:hypothetical protein
MSISAANSLAAGDIAYRSTVGGATDSTAGANAKLWLPIWSGEVLHAYDEYRSFEPMVTSKTIASGREMEFPITGTVDLKPAWDAGEYLVGGKDATGGNFSITLDKRPMAAHFELDNVDLMITQWEYRQELARQAGQTLANARDKQIATFIAGAAVVPLTAADPRSGLSLPEVGNLSTWADDAERALEVLEQIEDFVVECQENSVPVGAVYCAVTPKMFQQIRRLGVAESSPAGVAAAGNMQPMFGGVAAAGGLGAQFTQGMNSLSDSLVYMGVTILKSNHLPKEDYVASPIGETRYNLHGDDAQVRALIWMPECVASLRKTGLAVDTEDDIRRNTTFTVASMMSGTGILKPELAKIVVTADATNADTRAKVGNILTTGATGAGAGVAAFFGYENA